MKTDRVLASQQLPPAGESIVFYSESTGVHRGVFDAGIWRDIFNQPIERVTCWWPTQHRPLLAESHA